MGRIYGLDAWEVVGAVYSAADSCCGVEKMMTDASVRSAGLHRNFLDFRVCQRGSKPGDVLETLISSRNSSTCND